MVLNFVVTSQVKSSLHSKLQSIIQTIRTQHKLFKEYIDQDFLIKTIIYNRNYSLVFIIYSYLFYAFTLLLNMHFHKDTGTPFYNYADTVERLTNISIWQIKLEEHSYNFKRLSIKYLLLLWQQICPMFNRKCASMRV